MSMKHYIHITLAIVLTIVAACTEHPIVQVPQVPESSRSYIFFEPEVMEAKTTKAAILEGKQLPTEAGTAFGVIGYYKGTSIFGPANLTQDSNNEYAKGIAKVYRPNQGGTFQYDKLVAWRDRNAEATDLHHFYAFYPLTLENDASHPDKEPRISYTLPKTEAQMVDILTAYTPTPRCASVVLEFKHHLWALDVEVVNRQTGDGYSQPGAALTPPDLTVVSVKVTMENIPSAGTMVIAGTDCTVSSRATQEYTLPQTGVKISPVDNPETTDVKENASIFGPLLFLPTVVSYDDGMVGYKLDFKFKNHWGVEYTESFNGTFKLERFEAGKRYKLTIVKKDTEANVDLDVTDWTPYPVEHTFQ